MIRFKLAPKFINQVARFAIVKFFADSGRDR